MPPESEPPPIPSQKAPRRPTLRVALGCIILLALALFFWKVCIAIQDPSFGGDAGIRMNSADRVLLRLGNRVWLPYLQAHISAFYRLKLPYEWYDLIPCCYFFVAVLFLGLLGLRILGRTYPGLLFTLAVMLCFAEQRQISRLSVTLYQEVIGIALLYVLLYAGALNLRKSPVLLIIGCIALLARDTFLIYLFSLTLLNWKAILSSRTWRLAFLFLWSVPVLWLLAIPVGYLMHDGRLPAFPLEWPLMINTDAEPAVSQVSTSLGSLWAALLNSRAVYLLAAVVLAWVVNRLGERPGDRASRGESEEFRSRLKAFSLLSLAIVYTAIVLFNPWKVTFGNSRMAVPLIEHLFIWTLIVMAATLSRRGVFSVVARTILMAGLVLAINPQTGAWVPRQNPLTKTIYPELERLLKESSPGARPLACFGAEDVFVTMERFVAPTLYARRRYLPRGTDTIPEDCSLLISPPASVPPNTGNFVRLREYRIEGDSYVVYRRRDSP